MVQDLGTRSGYGHQGMYHPAAVGEIDLGRVVLQVSGDPLSFTPVLQSVALDVDPGLRLHNVITLTKSPMDSGISSPSGPLFSWP